MSKTPAGTLARNLAESLLVMLRKLGTVSATADACGVNRNYFSRSAKRGSLDLLVLLQALEANDIPWPSFLIDAAGQFEEGPVEFAQRVVDRIGDKLPNEFKELVAQ